MNDLEDNSKTKQNLLDKPGFLPTNCSIYFTQASTKYVHIDFEANKNTINGQVMINY